jgi:FAD/FMN-containing dehydrogenase
MTDASSRVDRATGANPQRACDTGIACAALHSAATVAASHLGEKDNRMQRRDFVRSSLLAAAISLPGVRVAYALARSGPAPDVAGITGDGREVTLRGAAISKLAEQLQGQLLLAGDNGYDNARRVLNPSFDKHPALIAMVTGVADIQAAVRFARTHNLLVAVKCGGHSASGQSTCDRGMLIDLSGFRSVRVDPNAKRVWATGGTLLGQIDQASMAHGLATPMGTVSHTGIGGLTLGGGFGRLARRHGMSIDNLTAIEIVSADGELRRASAQENPDLFWGARGGGGNFGIVTAFEFGLHPMQPQVIAGDLVFPIARAHEVLGRYGEYAPIAPDELYLDPAIVLPPRGAPGYVSLTVCYSGTPANLERALEPIRKLGKPTSDTLKTMDYLQLQRAGDISDPRAQGSYMKSGFVTKMPSDLVAAIVDGLEGHPTRVTMVFGQHCGGAAGRVANDATAFASRSAAVNLMAVSGWRFGDDPAPHIEATRRHWKKIEKFTSGFYINDIAREATAKDVDATFGRNHAKLVALKTQYDPSNLFRLNANVAPKKA